MAAIEKVCEFSGEYPAWLMYGYKRNHIQIIPKFRKKFHGATAKLHIFAPEQRLITFNKGNLSTSRYYDSLGANDYNPPFANEKEYINYLRCECKLYMAQQHWFALEVFDKHLQGEVEGVYAETTYSLACVVRRMKRLVRNNRLEIIKHSCSYNEWDDIREKELLAEVA